MNDMQTLQKFLTENINELVEEWRRAVADSWRDNPELSTDGALEQQCRNLLREVINILPDYNPDGSTWMPPQNSGLLSLLQDVGALWAHKGLRASETSTFILTLKYLVADKLLADEDVSDKQRHSLLHINERLMDRLLVISHESYLRGREKLIQQQSLALLELSSPVVKMWEQFLLLPLIGVIDTTRARQITEALLSEIARQEALVTVIDLTGVPVFDTAVAGHLMKTISAAQMLGCKVIMTGISPEGAMVLTKLGIDFRDVITRGNLHSGVREAFQMLGQTVTAVGEQGNGA